MANNDLEQAILEATRHDDDCLDDLLQQAVETMEEAEFDHLCDKVHQILSEAVYEAREWNVEVEGE